MTDLSEKVNEEIKNYLRVDEDYDDILIQTLIKSAESYISNAGVCVSYEVELYSLAIKMLVLHWYENREVSGASEQIPFGLDNIIIQLKYCYEAQI